LTRLWEGHTHRNPTTFRCEHFAVCQSPPDESRLKTRSKELELDGRPMSEGRLLYKQPPVAQR
jgi:hypothetical protein